MLFAGPDHCRITTPALRVQAFPGSMSMKSVAGKRRLHVFKTNRLINDQSLISISCIILKNINCEPRSRVIYQSISPGKGLRITKPMGWPGQPLNSPVLLSAPHPPRASETAGVEHDSKIFLALPLEVVFWGSTTIDTTKKWCCTPLLVEKCTTASCLHPLPAYLQTKRLHSGQRSVAIVQQSARRIWKTEHSLTEIDMMALNARSTTCSKVDKSLPGKGETM